MEIPFYLSFREFEREYYNNLEKWFENDQNTSEIDFLKSLTELYKPYLSYNLVDKRLQVEDMIGVKNCFFPYFENIDASFCIIYGENAQNNSIKSGIQNRIEQKNITMMEYAQCVLDKINNHFRMNNIILKEPDTITDFLNDYIIITSKEKTGYCLDYNLHQQKLSFLKAFIPAHGQTVDMILYRNFHYSIIRIAEFIDRKLFSVKAFEHGIFYQLKSEARLQNQSSRSHHYLTLFN